MSAYVHTVSLFETDTDRNIGIVNVSVLVSFLSSQFNHALGRLFVRFKLTCFRTTHLQNRLDCSSTGFFFLSLISDIQTVMIQWVHIVSTHTMCVDQLFLCRKIYARSLSLCLCLSLLTLIQICWWLFFVFQWTRNHFLYAIKYVECFVLQMTINIVNCGQFEMTKLWQNWRIFLFFTIKTSLE